VRHPGWIKGKIQGQNVARWAAQSLCVQASVLNRSCVLFLFHNSGDLLIAGNLRNMGRRSVIPYLHGRVGSCIAVYLLKSRLSLLEVSLRILTSAQPFIAQALGSYIVTKA
jgi:hypothetical protein